MRSTNPSYKTVRLPEWSHATIESTTITIGTSSSTASDGVGPPDARPNATTTIPTNITVITATSWIQNGQSASDETGRLLLALFPFCSDTYSDVSCFPSESLLGMRQSSTSGATQFQSLLPVTKPCSVDEQNWLEKQREFAQMVTAAMAIAPVESLGNTGRDTSWNTTTTTTTTNNDNPIDSSDTSTSRLMPLYNDQRCHDLLWSLHSHSALYPDQVPLSAGQY